jgi:ubiquinone/menaquinone biosynthesis C-methylase UbiE
MVVIKALLSYSMTAALCVFVIYQVRKPSKWIGGLFARAMNEGHSTMTDWGLRHVVIENDFAILDVGCGGGRTVQKMAALATAGMVYGIDYADGSVDTSTATNAALIAAERVAIQKASVSQLPFPADKFDLVTAVETQYYWPNLAEDMRETFRVLKPGGKLMVIAETYKGGRYDKLKWPVMWLLRSSHLSVNDQRELFSQAGYTGIEIIEEPKKGWMCARGSKPGGLSEKVQS